MNAISQTEQLHLVAYKLCPYVQRSVITLEEKGIPYQRTDIELANKPDWFKALSPTGKVPLLMINDKDVIFESAVICEYLDETTEGSLLPSDAKQKAQYRAWIEFSTGLLNQIGKLYNTNSKEEFEKIQRNLAEQFSRVDQVLNNRQVKQALGPYFNGEYFSLVDAVFAPVFRYFEVFEQFVDISCFKGLDTVQDWRKNLAQRPSVQKAVSEDYHQALIEFVKKKDGYLAKKIERGNDLLIPLV